MTALPPLVVTPPPDDPLLTRKDLASRWQCSLSYIEKRPAAELPPTCSVLPGQHRYRLSDILRFEASRVDQAHPLAGGMMGPGGMPSGRAERSSPGFPIRLPVTGKTASRRSGRRPVPAILEEQRD